MVFVPRSRIPPDGAEQPRAHSQYATAQAGPAGLVLIGVSTGGPSVLEDLLPRLPADFPWAVLVAIHMPAAITGTFARRMNQRCAIQVEEVERQTTLRSGRVYVARGGCDMLVAQRNAELVAQITPPHASVAWHPSVARLVDSALGALEPQTLIAVQLTGMGDDGAAAMKRLFDAGGRTIAESEESALIFGMPRSLIELGGATRVLRHDAIADQLIEWTQRPS